MCGIAGVFHPPAGDTIERMTEALVHRGPDEHGYFRGAEMHLGQRRLSIIDLTSGKQPITNEEGTLQLICNGEIYNSPFLRRELEAAGHRFRTTTDVETILHLYEEYGTGCVSRLQGMFAFALWDEKHKRLLLARDHMGQKPLFFYHRDGLFAFASEVKALLAGGVVPPRIDLDGLWHYISLRFIPDRYSLFREIQKLPAASFLVFENDRFTIEKYWELRFTPKHPGSEKEIEDGLHDLLLETVRSHLLSDVRVGAFLSGGIDSGTVCAMMAKLSPAPVPVFSIGVEEQSFNELPYARLVAHRHGLEAHERIVKADVVKLLPEMVYHMDEPSDPFALGVYLVAGVAREFVKVVLGGDGGDESFAGYDRFAGNRLVDLYCVLPHWFRRTVMKKLVACIPESYSYKSLAQKAAWMNEMSFYRQGERYAHSMSFLRFTQGAKEELFTADCKRKVQDPDSIEKILVHFNAANAKDLVDKMLYTDLMTRMPDHLLPIVDRMGMAHSLESRSPLVDYKLVEYAAAIPAELKLKGKNLKYILKKVAARYLPPELIERKKQGFGFPIGIWMRTQLQPLLVNLFRQSRLVELGIFDPVYMQRLLDEHLSGKANHDFRLWILLNLEVWHRLYFEGKSVASMQEFIARLGKAPG
jgi:asparagine synthase (glutamine-hydrolysing)